MKKNSIFKTLIFNTVIVLFLIGLGLGFTVFGDSIKYRVLNLVANPHTARILGEQILQQGPVPNPREKAEEVGETLQTEVHESVAEAKQKALDTKVSDMIDFGSKMKKIASDFSNLKANIIEKVQER